MPLAMDIEPRSSAPVLVPGDQFGRYIIIRQIGAGGMGIVYLARDPALDRRVALKLLRASALSVTNAPSRLVREAQTMAKLSHPNVGTIYDSGSLDGALYLAMEYVRGCTLREWQDDGPRTQAEKLAVYVQAARGLAAAHARGICHRDFKPENVLVDEHGRARVVDFGLARADNLATDDSVGRIPLNDTLVDARTLSGAQQPLTQEGAVLGTPGYMAPEQIRGKVADARSDQFAFCVALFEALHGERPFRGGTVREILDATEAGRVVAPRRRSRVPPEVFAVLARGLSVRSEDRHSSMDTLVAALERAQTRRRRKRIVGVVAPFLAAAAAVVGFWSSRPPPTAEERQAEAVGHFHRAQELYQRSDYQGCIAELERARSLDPSSRQLVFNLGLAREKAGHSQEAIRQFVRYQSMDDFTPEARARVDARIQRLAEAGPNRPPDRSSPSAAPPPLGVTPALP
jgi:serine/threonine protein kinase